MRLLKIGRDASCDIGLHSVLVSALHAEIVLMDSGDIMLEDKGSRNGTYIMNQRIQPGKSVMYAVVMLFVLRMLNSSGVRSRCQKIIPPIKASME